MSPEDAEKQSKENDPHFAEYYLKQIPSTDDERATAHEVIQEGLYNMGVILKDKLEDYDGSYVQFNRLLTDYPDNVYRLDTYYNLYLMYVRMGLNDRAEVYRQLILRDFAESKYGIALQNPDYIDNLRTMESQQQALYENAFEAYMDNRNTEVHAIYKDVNERYPMTKLMPKFMFLEALAYVTERKGEEFNSTLRTLLERYPDTDLTPTVSAWLKGMAQGRQLQAGIGGKNMRGMIWDISLSNDSTATAADSINFALNPADPLLLVFVFPTDKVSSNELLYNIARHNFRSFVVKNFDLEQMNFGRLGMILVKSFESIDELNHYRRVMAASTDFKLPAGVRPVVISVPNFDTLLHSGGTLDDYFRFLEAQNYKDAQADILPYSEIETLDEADEAAADRSSAPADNENSNP
jgi:tetratricopeptide (TPR) repeat protein